MAWTARSVVVLFIFALHLLFTAQAQTGNTVTCDIPSVEPLANTSVTCHFPENVNQTRRIVTISFYKGAQYTASNENYILECWWLSGRMDCDVKEGYKFNRMISHELTLEIPQVSTKHIGGYACKLSNMNRNDITYCELKIKLEGKTMCDVPSVPLNSRTSLTCYFPEDLSKNTADFSVYHHSGRSESVNVISCTRTGEHRSCNTIRGYEFDQTVANHLTVGIPKAQEDQEGSYSCHYTSSAPVRYENCSLTLITVTSFCNISSVVETEPASLTCTFNVDVNATKNNFSLVRIGGADSKEQQCPRSWTRFEESCYILPDQNVTWFEARELCLAIGGNIVDVESADENNFLISLIKSHRVSGAWIGLEDFAEKGRFVWSSDQMTPSYTNWASGQPNDQGRDQDCGWIPNQPTWWTPGMWDDENCSSKLHTICKQSH